MYIPLAGLKLEDPFRSTVSFRPKTTLKEAIIKIRSATIASFSTPSFFLLALFLELMKPKKLAFWSLFTQMTTNFVRLVFEKWARHTYTQALLDSCPKRALPPYINFLQQVLNPFTAKFSQKQTVDKFPNFILWNFEKQIASCVSTGTQPSFEWSHHMHRISSTDSNRLKSSVTLSSTRIERVNPLGSY